MADCPTLNYISVATGGGGLDRAFELAIPDALPVVYLERECFAVSHLGDAMEKSLLAPAPVWPDARTFRGRRWRGAVDFVIGGIPCQPHSLAGERLGDEDERDLWSDTRRIWVQSGAWGLLIENVPGMLSAKPGQTPGAERVRRDLHRMGCSVEGGLWTAEETGWPQERERFFLLAIHPGRWAAVSGWRDLALAHGYGRGAGWDGAAPDDDRRRGAGLPEGDQPASRGGELADAGRSGIERQGGARHLPGSPGAGEAQGPEREWNGDAIGDGREAVADASGAGLPLRDLIHPYCWDHSVCFDPNQCEGGRTCWLKSNPERAPAFYDDLTGEWVDVGDAESIGSGRGLRKVGEVEDGDCASGSSRHVGVAQGVGRREGGTEPVVHGRGRDAPGGDGEPVGDADGGDFGGRPDVALRRPEGRTPPDWSGATGFPPPGPRDTDGWRHLLANWPGLEPAVRRDADGMAYRIDRLRMLGNGVHPLEGAYAICSLAVAHARRATPGADLLVLMAGIDL